MNILLCNYEYPPLGGGGGVITALLAEELAKRHEVTVLTSRAMGLSATNVIDGVKIVRVSVMLRNSSAVGSVPSLVSYIPMAIRKGKELVRSTRFDIVNTHFVLPTGPVGNALSAYADVPNVLSVHGGDLYDPSKALSPHRHPVLRVWIRTLLGRADMVVGSSNDVINNVGRYYTDRVEPIKIPLGIERPPTGTAPRAEYGFEADDVLLVTVGRLVPRKAVDQLVHMMDALRDTRARLLVIGSGPEEETLRPLVQAKGLDTRVRFMGNVSDEEKFRLLRMSDIYVSSSQHEGFGIVFLEGMACGLPIICYNHGGQTDFLTGGVTGYVVSLNDTDLFTDRCRELVCDANKRRAFGDANLEHVSDYLIDRMADSYESAFLEAIATRKEKVVGLPHRA